jgi:hypothetical protein
VCITDPISGLSFFAGCNDMKVGKKKVKNVSLKDGGKVVSFMRRPFFTTRKDYWYNRPSVLLKGLGQLAGKKKTTNYLTRNLTHDLLPSLPDKFINNNFQSFFFFFMLVVRNTGHSKVGLGHITKGISFRIKIRCRGCNRHVIRFRSLLRAVVK